MDADAPAMICQVERNGAANPSRSAGHENGRGFVVLSHASFGECFGAESDRQSIPPVKSHFR